MASRPFPRVPLQVPRFKSCPSPHSLPKPHLLPSLTSPTTTECSHHVRPLSLNATRRSFSTRSAWRNKERSRRHDHVQRAVTPHKARARNATHWWTTGTRRNEVSCCSFVSPFLSLFSRFSMFSPFFLLSSHSNSRSIICEGEQMQKNWNVQFNSNNKIVKE